MPLRRTQISAEPWNRDGLDHSHGFVTDGMSGLNVLVRLDQRWGSYACFRNKTSFFRNKASFAPHPPVALQKNNSAMGREVPRQRTTNQAARCGRVRRGRDLVMTTKQRQPHLKPRSFHA